MNVALIFDNKVRPDTTGFYCRRALGQIAEVEHFLPKELGQVPRQGFDLYLNIDDGMEYYLPRDLRPCAWWAIDTHLNYEYCRDRARDFDFVFTAQRDASLSFHAEGMPNTRWLPLGCDPEIHCKHNVPKEHDVCFVGNLFPGEREDLIRLLQSHFRKSFVGRRFFDEMAQTYSASRTVFNRSLRNDINMRVFEALACGSLLMTNDLTDNGQAELAMDGVHMATYRSAAELLDKLHYYLQHDDLREKIAAAGRNHALAKHTYRQRMEQVLTHVAASARQTTIAARLPSDTAKPVADSADTLLERVVGSAHDILLVGRDFGPLLATLRNQATAADVLTVPADDAVGLAAAEGIFKSDTPKKRFDAIIAGGILELLSDPQAWLRQARENLAVGGQLLATVANLRERHVVRSLIEGDWTYAPGSTPGIGHRRSFTRREVEKLFYRAGFGAATFTTLPNPDHEEWIRRGRPSEVNLGALRIVGMKPASAEEFYTTTFLTRAVPVERPAYGVTSIVIPTHNQLAYTKLCVESIHTNTDQPYELIFVDNASTDGTLDYLRSLPGAHVIANAENRGFPAGCNQGIRVAKGQQVLLLNNDTVVTTGWLDRMLRALASDPRIGLVGPSSNNVGGEQMIDVSYDQLSGLDGFAWEWGKANDGRYADTDRLIGFCLLIRREMIDRVGLLDERFGIGCFDDDDYCRQVMRAGFRVVYAKDAFVHHFGSRTFRALGIDYAALMRKNQLLFNEKWQAIESSTREAPTIAPSSVVASAPATETARPPLRPSTPAFPLFGCRFEGGGLRLVRKKIGLSLCMIVRNNAKTIRACLESIRPYVDEMIVVDTGSTDETPFIAAELGARVFHFPWCDNFSAARNESLRLARGEWLFWMDSDDVIPEHCGRKLRELIARAKPRTLGFTIDVHFPGADEYGDQMTLVSHVKLFRNRPDLRFEHRIHEQILPALTRAGGPSERCIGHTDLYVIHSGYDHSPEGQVRKLERDLRILHKELREQPQHPFTLFNLGMTYIDTNQFAEALGYVERCIEHSGERDSHVRKAFSFKVCCHQGLGQPDQAWDACQEGLRRFPLDAELRFRRAGLLRQQHRFDEAIAGYFDVLHRREPKHFRSIVEGIEGCLSRHNLASLFQEKGDWSRAEEQWRLIVKERPKYRAGWRGLGEVLLRQGKHTEAQTVAEQLLASERLNGDGLLLRGSIAAAQKNLPAACSDWDRVVAEHAADRDLFDAATQLLFENIGPAAAKTALEKLVERAPADSSALHNLATVYLAIAEWERAADACRASLRVRPNWPATQAILERALRELDPRGKVLTPANPGAVSIRAAYVLRFGNRMIETQFTTRGIVDDAILRDLWEGDAYGLAKIAQPPALVLDIGAHIGAFSLLASHVWPSAHVIACEPDRDNLSLLYTNLAGRQNLDVVEAAIVADGVNEVEFHAVPDKTTQNSGGGSIVRPEVGSVRVRVPALSIIKLWHSRAIVKCDLLKLDCEGCEASLLKALGEAGLLPQVGQIVGEWHAADDRPETRNRVCEELRTLLDRTHEVEFRQPLRGREGHFTARRREQDAVSKQQGIHKRR